MEGFTKAFQLEYKTWPKTYHSELETNKNFGKKSRESEEQWYVVPFTEIPAFFIM